MRSLLVTLPCSVLAPSSSLYLPASSSSAGFALRKALIVASAALTLIQGFSVSISTFSQYFCAHILTGESDPPNMPLLHQILSHVAGQPISQLPLGQVTIPGSIS